jgi:hypothetical protein
VVDLVVPDAVDFEADDAAIRQIPLGVQVTPAAARVGADPLANRLRQARLPAQPRDVDLRKRLSTTLDIRQSKEHHRPVPDPPATVEDLS